MVELPDHDYFVACQFHPEFKSRPLGPSLFSSFVGAHCRISENRKRTGAGQGLREWMIQFWLLCLGLPRVQWRDPRHRIADGLCN